MNALHERLSRFGLALLIVAVATYLRVLLTPLVQDRLPFGTYTVAVIIAAWSCGVWPAVLALAASTICAAHFVIPPEESLGIDSPADLFAVSIFFIVGTISIILFARFQEERKSAIRQSRENEQLNNELRERDRQKDEFLALLAHELRSPLAPIGNSIALLEKEPELPASSQSIVKVLSKNFSHLVRLTNDLLDVSRYLRDTIELKREPTNLAECVEAAVEMTRSELADKQHELIIEPPAQPAVCFIDPGRICQVLCNLLSNAIKYTPDRGRIILRWELTEKETQIEVRDNGLGIPDAIREQIFTPFFQANSKQSRYAPGLGLGLSIVKKLIELHEGTIQVDSGGDHRGSRFTVRLPAIADAPKQYGDQADREACFDTHSAPAADVSPMPPGIGNEIAAENPKLDRRVLIVDDDPDTSDSLKRLFAIEGYITKEASNGIEACRTFQSFLPAAVILDIGLPEMSGYEVAKKLRQECGNHRFRIIAVSGWGSQTDLERGREAGFDEHLVKPVQFDRLLQLIQN